MEQVPPSVETEPPRPGLPETAHSETARSKTVQSEGVQSGPTRRAVPTGRLVLVVGVGFAVVLVGGYGGDWRWTGFRQNATLWNWLELLVLPLAFATVPLWLRYRDRLHRRHRLVLAAAASAFVALVCVGYALDLSWTGFPGNRLWDWLELLVLPVAVASLPVWRELSEGLRPKHVVAIVAALAGLAVCAVGGYALDWSWTGFRGNTLYDWLHLLLVPLVLPLVLLPAYSGWMEKQTAVDE